MKRNRTPQAWQVDPSNVKTNKVQFWSNGTMVTAEMNQVNARQAVSEGRAFVMTEQAVGAMVNGQMSS